jgi:hypothetical protein
MPVSIFDAYFSYIFLIGGFFTGLFVILIMFTVAKTNSGKTETELDDRDKGLICLGVFVMVVSGFLYYASYDARRTSALGINERAETKGIVVGRERMETFYLSSFQITVIYNATIMFKTSTGESVKIKKRIEARDYDIYRMGTVVDLLYSKRDPYIVELLNNDDSIRKYLGVQNRPVNLKDLLKLVDMSNVQAGSFLNSINYKWTYNETDKRWENARRNISISIEEGVCVVYMTWFFGKDGFNEDFENMGFVRDDGETQGSGKKFKSDKFLATLTSQLIQGKKLEDIKRFNVITLTKR